MKKIFLSFPLSLVLISCGTLADGQSQLVTIKTPGAENAKCYIENQDLKVSAYTDETVRIMKSPHDLVVRCAAPGNRQKTILVKRELNNWSILNVANGFVPGVTYDYLSRGLFDYPDVFTIGFGELAVKPYNEPDYMANDLRSKSHIGNAVYRGPSEVISEQNKYDIAPRLEKKMQSNDDFNSFSPSAGGNDVSSMDTQSKPAYQSQRPIVSYDPDEETK